MPITWVLVANASEAKLYESKGRSAGVKLHREFSHPRSREKGSELTTDRPGHYKSASTNRGAYSPGTEAKEHEHERFALELAAMLDEGRTANAYQRAVIVASPEFLGLLNHAVNAQVNNLVTGSISKDYTRLSEKELAEQLWEML